MTQVTTVLRASGKVWYLEWLRLAACLAVVLTHCFTTVLDNATVNEVGMLRSACWIEILAIACRWAVPIFLMVTGALLLDPGKEMCAEKILGYFFRILTVLLIFGTIYALIEIVFDEHAFDFGMVPMALARVLQGKSWTHLWYLYDLLGIYLILPVLRSFVAQHDQREIGFFLIILFIFSLIVPTINNATGLEFKSLIWFGSSVFYVLLGRYLSAYDHHLPSFACLGVAALAVEMIVSACGICLSERYLPWVWSPSSPFVACWAAYIFLLFKSKADQPMRSGGLAASIAKYSFAIYLVHPIFANLLYKGIGWAPSYFSIGVFEVITFLLIFIPSFLLSIVLKRIPVLRRYL